MKKRSSTANAQAQRDVDRRIARAITAMADKRDDYKHRLMSHLSGALTEYYKAELAALNGQTKWTIHWRSEVTLLLERAFNAALRHSIRGFRDRRKALSEVIREMQTGDASYRTIAYNQLTRDYELTRLTKKLPPNAADSFWLRVTELADTVLANY